jgi:hypothetical protein
LPPEIPLFFVFFVSFVVNLFRADPALLQQADGADLISDIILTLLCMMAVSGFLAGMILLFSPLTFRLLAIWTNRRVSDPRGSLVSGTPAHGF